MMPILWGHRTRRLLSLTPTLLNPEHYSRVEYNALSVSRSDVIPIMQLLEEMKSQQLVVICTKPYMK
eukprot:CCRYP_018996-RA/>CCRYP_018996-RA protein AED:0.40 eAED:0.40 QI:0/0/0/1/0/0/2/0/66